MLQSLREEGREGTCEGDFQVTERVRDGTGKATDDLLQIFRNRCGASSSHKKLERAKSCQFREVEDAILGVCAKMSVVKGGSPTEKTNLAWSRPEHAAILPEWNMTSASPGVRRRGLSPPSVRQNSQ